MGRKRFYHLSTDYPDETRPIIRAGGWQMSGDLDGLRQFIPRVLGRKGDNRFPLRLRSSATLGTHRG